MPVNLNLSPAGRAKGRKKRLNPLPQLLTATPIVPNPAPQTFIETLSPARLVVRAIRNKESNVDITPNERLDLLTQSTARINAELLAARKQFATRCIPRTDTPYCNPACASSVGSEGKPSNPASNYHKGNAHPAITSPHDRYFTLNAGTLLNNLLDASTLDTPVRQYRQDRDAILSYFQLERAFYHARLTPLDTPPSNTPSIPNHSVPFTKYLRRRRAIHDSQIQNELLLHQLKNAICDKVGTRALVSGKKASPRIKQALLKDDIRASDHGITRAEFRDIESAVESVGESLGLAVHTLLAQSTGRIAASELADNWLTVSRNLSDNTVSVQSAPTMKGAEWKAKQLHSAHPNTVNAVVSRAQALSARWDALLTDNSKL